MQYICAFTEIELEVIFWQQGIGAFCYRKKIIIRQENKFMDIREIQKNSRSVEAEFTREVILWIVVAVHFCCLSVTFGFGGTIRRYSQPLLFLVYLELFHIYFQSYYLVGTFFLPVFEPGKPGWQPLKI